MRFKVVPPAPDSLDELTAAWRALPLVPKPEESCCARVMDRAGVPSQDEAKEWITFLRALGLAAEGEQGYRRLRTDDADPTVADLGAAFREGVYGAEDLLDVLAAAEGPVGADAAFERFEAYVPQWERNRNPDWRSTWRERVGRMLDWAVVFGLVERVDGGYVLVAE